MKEIKRYRPVASGLMKSSRGELKPGDLVKFEDHAEAMAEKDSIIAGLMANQALNLSIKSNLLDRAIKSEAEAIAAQEQVQKLAAENSTVRVMNDALSEELRGYESDGAYEGPNMHKLWHSNADMPDTDAVIREIGAKAFEELAAGQRGLAEVRARQFRAQAAHKAIAIAEMLEREAARLRAGEQL